MTGNRKEVNKAETRKHIIDVFLDLLSRSGLEGITVSALCREAGVAKSTFYLYFEDKYSVLDEIEQELLTGLAGINSRLVDTNLALVAQGRPLTEATRTMDFILAHLDQLRVIMGPRGDPRFENVWRRNIADSFQDRFRREKGDRKSAGLACTIFACTLIGIYHYFIFEASDLTREEFELILGNTFKYALLDFEAPGK